MKSRATSACPLCDSKNLEACHDRTATYTYLNKKHVLEGQEHTVCLDCGTSFYETEQIKHNNLRFIEWSKTLVKDIAPWEIREIRDKYDLSQEDANRAFNCGSATQFSKWERGIVAPTGTAALTLRMALEDLSFMKRLMKKAGLNTSTIEQGHETTAATQYWLNPTNSMTGNRVTVTHDVPAHINPQAIGFITSSSAVQCYTEMTDDLLLMSFPPNRPLAPAHALVAKQAVEKRSAHRKIKS